jgi:hypothetical protein
MCQFSQIVGQPTDCTFPVRYLYVPGACNSGPSLTVLKVFVFNVPLVSSKVTKALYPGFLEGWNFAVQFFQHLIRQVNELPHVLDAVREMLPKQFQEGMDTILPHTCRHQILIHKTC